MQVSTEANFINFKLVSSIAVADLLENVRVRWNYVKTVRLKTKVVSSRPTTIEVIVSVYNSWINLGDSLFNITKIITQC